MNAQELRSSVRRSPDENRKGPLAPSWIESKQQAVRVAAQEVSPDADARQALGFMPLKMKGAAIRWRGL